jgi:putative ABC transport system ATP-binding protein
MDNGIIHSPKKEKKMQESSKNDSMIAMMNINKGYMLGEEKVPVLHDICFQVEKGEFVAILGPSGSGKTTLMNIIGCMDVLDEGSYFLDGQPIHEMPEKRLNDVRNKEIGFIFQNYQLISTYNILQNITMPLIVRGMTTKEAEEKCMDTIRLLGLDHRMKHKPSELSGGQKQRVSIARALVGEPAVLLADEPTGALDSNSGKDVLKLFKDLNDMGHTIVMITHDLNVAKSAGRIVHIVDGCLKE